MDTRAFQHEQASPEQEDATTTDRHPPLPHHLYELERTIHTLADSLSHAGRGAHLQELLRIIRWPGWTTPAELAFTHAILEHIGVQVRSLERLQAELVDAARKVARKQA